MTTRIRNAVIAPVLVVSGVALLAILVVGMSALLASQKEALSLEDAAATALHAKEMEENLQDAQSYVREIMAMVELRSEREVRVEFEQYQSAINDDLLNLRRSTNQTYLEQVNLLATTVEYWFVEAEFVLGIVPTTDVKGGAKLGH